VALSSSDLAAIRAAGEALAVMVWRREADGRWRIARELLNEDV
jgi:ketosteroid isomerase-like protein